MALAGSPVTKRGLRCRLVREQVEHHSQVDQQEPPNRLNDVQQVQDIQKLTNSAIENPTCSSEATDKSTTAQPAIEDASNDAEQAPVQAQNDAQNDGQMTAEDVGQDSVVENASVTEKSLCRIVGGVSFGADIPQ